MPAPQHKVQGLQRDTRRLVKRLVGEWFVGLTSETCPLVIKHGLLENSPFIDDYLIKTILKHIKPPLSSGISDFPVAWVDYRRVVVVDNWELYFPGNFNLATSAHMQALGCVREAE